MAQLENVFSWSKSRAEEFKECQRKYFYARYVSWGGWDKSAPKAARMAYIFKNLKNRWAWKGETVHHVIETSLKAMRAASSLPLEAAQASLTERMRLDWRASKTKKYLDDPKRSPGLFEHEYDKPVSDAVWKAVHDEAAQALANFYRSPLYQELLTDDKKDWLIIEDLEEFDFEGAKIYVKLDFARRKDGQIQIFDWKTGKEEKGSANVQIGAYAIYAMKKWKAPLSSIGAYLVYVASPLPDPKPQKLDEAVIEEAKRVMTDSIRDMRSLLLDPVRNIPKGSEHFRYTENERLCANCSFYKMCEKYEKVKK